MIIVFYHRRGLCFATGATFRVRYCDYFVLLPDKSRIAPKSPFPPLERLLTKCHGLAADLLHSSASETVTRPFGNCLLGPRAGHLTVRLSGRALLHTGSS